MPVAVNAFVTSMGKPSGTAAGEISIPVKDGVEDLLELQPVKITRLNKTATRAHIFFVSIISFSQAVFLYIYFAVGDIVYQQEKAVIIK